MSMSIITANEPGILEPLRQKLLTVQEFLAIPDDENIERDLIRGVAANMLVLKLESLSNFKIGSMGKSGEAKSTRAKSAASFDTLPHQQSALMSLTSRRNMRLAKRTRHA
jgi:hypothetical protein